MRGSLAANILKAACIFLILSLFFPALYAQETERRTIPTALLRPQRGEALRYPTDIVIGELGRGSASEEAYVFANEVLEALNMGLFEAPVLSGLSPMLVDDLVEEIGSLGRTRRFRLGGGRTELDGSVSFLVRFLGAEESLIGELFLRFAQSWVFDDLILEEKRQLSEIRNNYRFDFSPYERFF